MRMPNYDLDALDPLTSLLTPVRVMVKDLPALELEGVTRGTRRVRSLTTVYLWSDTKHCWEKELG